MLSRIFFLVSILSKLLTIVVVVIVGYFILDWILGSDWSIISEYSNYGGFIRWN